MGGDTTRVYCAATLPGAADEDVVQEEEDEDEEEEESVMEEEEEVWRVRGKPITQKGATCRAFIMSIRLENKLEPRAEESGTHQREFL